MHHERLHLKSNCVCSDRQYDHGLRAGPLGRTLDVLVAASLLDVYRTPYSASRARSSLLELYP